jgi:uncharacterized damage-inducible protein DinB
MSTSPSAAASSCAHAGLADLQHELDTTRRVLARVPEEHLAWKPHAKSYSLGQLARHVAEIPGWVDVTLTTDALDGADLPPSGPVPTAVREISDAFERTAAQAVASLAKASEEELARTWTLRVGDHVIFAMPKSRVLRGFVISHLIHHRAQLAVYLRLLDVPVPSIYGPSADER